MASINATDLRAGTAFLYEDKPFKVKKYSLIKMGRGGATVRVSCVNLENGANIEHAFSSNLSFDKIDLQKKQFQYLYKQSLASSAGKDEGFAYFMNLENYEQVEVPLSILDTDIFYLKEGENADILFWGDRPMSVDLPPNVVLEVVECGPGVKGNTVSNLYKPAKLSNGLEVRVPLFIKVGEKIKVDTRSGDYMERAK